MLDLMKQFRFYASTQCMHKLSFAKSFSKTVSSWSTILHKSEVALYNISVLLSLWDHLRVWNCLYTNQHFCDKT